MTQFLEKKLKKLAESIKDYEVLSQNPVSNSLFRFIESAELVLGLVEIEEQQKAIGDLKILIDEILKSIFDKSLLTANEIAEYQVNIDVKIENLISADIASQSKIVNDIGVALIEVLSDSDKRKEVHEMNAFMTEELIPYGLDEKAKQIPVSEFFTFPFGDYQGPDEKEWFGFHMRYLQMAVKQKKLAQSKYTTITNAINYVPKQKYKRYYNIFPNDKFEETTFMAIYDLWKNKTFENLRIL